MQGGYTHSQSIHNKITHYLHTLTSSSAHVLDTPPVLTLLPTALDQKHHGHTPNGNKPDPIRHPHAPIRSQTSPVQHNRKRNRTLPLQMGMVHRSAASNRLLGHIEPSATRDPMDDLVRSGSIGRETPSQRSRLRHMVV